MISTPPPYPWFRKIDIMIHKIIRNLVLLATVNLAIAISTTQAGFSSAMVLNPTTGASVTISPATSLATATKFVMTPSLTATGATGALVGGNGVYTSGSMTPITLNTNTSTGFTFTNSFGTFTQNVVAQGGFISGFDIFKIVGTFTFGSHIGSTAAEVDLAFTQVGGTGSPVSVSGTLGVSAVPEPASIAMLGLGLTAVGGFAARRRLATKRNALIA